MANTAQFTGVDSAVAMFLNRKCKAWSVWLGNQFLFSCIGESPEDAANELETLLTSLDKTGKAIYTLKVHDDIKKNQKITSKSECHGSFNFRLQRFDADSEGSFFYKEMREELKALKLQNETLMQELDEKDIDDEPPKDIIGTITELIVTDPAKIPVIVQSIYAIIKMFTGQTTQTGQPIMQPQPVAISGVTDTALQLAVDELKQFDPRLTEHLQKLAMIAKNDPAGFKSLLGILDNMG